MLDIAKSVPFVLVVQVVVHKASSFPIDVLRSTSRAMNMARAHCLLHVGTGFAAEGTVFEYTISNRVPHGLT